MKFIKFGFYYLASYLFLTGWAFLLIPTEFQKLLFGNPIYDAVPMQIAGMFAVLLSIVVFQIARKGLFELYTTTLFARSFAVLVLICLYAQTHNPLFVCMLGVVLVGILITLYGHFKIKRLG